VNDWLELVGEPERRAGRLEGAERTFDARGD
jgi:hypothetical protein